jgi:hypothetical protein
VQTTQLPQGLADAKKLIKDNKLQAGRELLREYLLYDNALLWFIRASEDTEEKLIAAELAVKLAPDNEVVQRAIASIRETSQHGNDAQIANAIQKRTGMSLRTARAVLWPFRGIRRPIGEALDEGVIAVKDLIWASEKANDEHIREAAKTVLYHQIIGLPEASGPSVLKVIVGSRYSEAEERFALLKGGILLGILFSIAAVSLLLGLAKLFNLLPEAGLFFVLFTFLTFPVVIVAVMFSNQSINQVENYRAGRRGEEQVVESLRNHLDGRWTLFWNLAWPHKNWGDIDLVLVGPGGVWVFEVKNYEGKIRNVGDQWHKRNRFWWWPLSKHPSKQARRNAARLASYLKNHEVRLRWAEPIVIWATDLQNIHDKAGSLELKNPATPVWRLEELDQHIDTLWQNSRQMLQESEIEEIVKALQNVVDEFYASEK